MRNKSLPLILTLSILLLAASACSFSVSTADIKNLEMARDPDGNEPAVTFSPQNTFYAVMDLKNAPDDTSVKAAWIAVAVEGADPNTLIRETEITTGSSPIYFELSNENLWPRGAYQVKIYLNEEIFKTLDFRVQ